MNLVKHTQFNKNCNIYKEKKRMWKKSQHLLKIHKKVEKSIKKLNQKVETIL